MRYKCIISYDGRNYVGFQSQINGIAIQDVIEAKLAVILQKPLKIVMSSRTDAKVHALGQVFHFDIDRQLDLYRFKGSLNSLLPDDIYLKSIEPVDDDFHARYSVKAKKYRYLINTGEHDVFLSGRVYDCYFKLDMAVFRKTAELFLGYHDFGSFNTSTYDEVKDQHRTIYAVDIKNKGDLIIVDIIGDGFLRHMVRMLVGTMIDTARGQKDIADVKRMLTHPDKRYHVYNISPEGLYLLEVYYSQTYPVWLKPSRVNSREM